MYITIDISGENNPEVVRNISLFREGFLAIDYFNNCIILNRENSKFC